MTFTRTVLGQSCAFWWSAAKHEKRTGAKLKTHNYSAFCPCSERRAGWTARTACGQNCALSRHLVEHENRTWTKRTIWRCSVPSQKRADWTKVHYRGHLVNHEKRAWTKRMIWRCFVPAQKNSKMDKIVNIALFCPPEVLFPKNSQKRSASRKQQRCTYPVYRP